MAICTMIVDMSSLCVFSMVKNSLFLLLWAVCKLLWAICKSLLVDYKNFACKLWSIVYKFLRLSLSVFRQLYSQGM